MHKLSTAPVVLASLSLAGAIASACSSEFTSCYDTRSCPASIGSSAAAGDTSTSGAAGVSGASHGGGSGESGGSEDGGSAGVSGAAGAEEGGMPCAGTGRPSEAPCLVSDEYAVFVAPSGNAGAPGTKLAPVSTLAEAVALAGTDKIVIACDGTYDEQLKLTTGARLYGGFSCPGSVTPWSYEAGKRATVAPVARGLALSVAAGASAVEIEDFEFDAQPGVDAGESSVAGFVNASTDVTLRRVKLAAGKGVDGANGVLTPVVFPLQSALNGNAAMGDAGGLAKLVMCPAGDSTKGGKGGDGGNVSVGPGSNGAPDLGAGKGGAQATACNSGGGGGDGANASPQPPAPGATQLGTIASTGWLGAAGTDGASGTPGQGGGGGTGADAGGGGGGGGAGGCGGAAGTGGKAGGSSIALLVLDASVTLAESQLIAADAGKGGAGVLGQDGQAQGGSAGLQVPDGCSGGKGGKGAKGGAGGGAAGGVSVGIVYQGTKPAIDELSTTLIGAAGAKGVGGVVGTNDGIDGKAQDLLELP